MFKFQSETGFLGEFRHTDL